MNDIQHLSDHARAFEEISERVLFDMFGVSTLQRSDVMESSSLRTKKNFIVSIYYTGTVFGEYVIAMDEETAARVIGIDETIFQQTQPEVREMICDAISETLNTIVGEAIVRLQETYAKLTVTAPRVYFGEIRYPQFRTRSVTMETQVGHVECHFCLDLMRLDLATSYDEAMASLVEINTKLKAANRHLAEQQAQLVHSEKMASIGVLASGVAHEINNPLFFVDTNLNALCDYVHVIESTISDYERLCATLLDCNAPVIGSDGSVLNRLGGNASSETPQRDIRYVLNDTKMLVSESRDGVIRIKDIVKSLKDFSNLDRGGIVDADLNAIVINAVKMLQTTLGDTDKIELKLGELSTMACNVGEIAQVCSIVILNAVQATPDTGKVYVSTNGTDVDSCLVVDDNGAGISKEDLDQIFDPFFTTKAEGEGTGLGLSIAYGIVRTHGGAITVESELGVGTKVIVRLPNESVQEELDEAECDAFI
ncbi:Sensor protein ZraS [Rosistilla carotiformis]|uniref:histidine kinase n=1 Tax=Rosistilla carotiformis TaxID=2528017 RepID=A0A518JWX4_9BACT|nr:ATP-binding protein [Rosistilla carotiformis]QDV70043.1 Sensor protein ZraS [Rosistilla carotiformis]